MMDRTLKALSLMLSYPTAELQAAMPEIGAVLAADPRLTAATRAALQRLTDDLGQGDLFDLQESYVMLFDRSRTLSLNLFEHVHGESRDRGGAMVSLIETYRAAGFEPATTELPDHLPVLAGIPVDASLRRSAGNLGGRGAYLRRACAPGWCGAKAGMTPRSPLFPSWQARRPTPRPWPACWPSPTTTRPIWPRSTPSGRKPKSPSAPTRTPAARRSATCWRGWTSRASNQPHPLNRSA